MFNAILFDLDGTLVNSLEDLAVSTNYALRRMGLPAYPVPDYRHFVGNGVRVLIESVLPEPLRGTAAVDAGLRYFNEYYNSHCLDHTKPYPGILELIAELKARGFRMAVNSNKPDAFVRDLVASIFGPDGFDSVAGQREGVPRKPDPTGALAACAEMGKMPADCIYLGDSDVDMKTALGAGMFPVGAVWGFRGREELEKAGAALLLETPTELLAYLDRTD